MTAVTVNTPALLFININNTIQQSSAVVILF